MELKEENLEVLLADSVFEEKEISEIKRDIKYYDRYLLIQEGLRMGFLKVLRQPFDDPYLELVLDECDLVNYKGRVSIDAFLDAMDYIFEIPQVIRCFLSNEGTFIRRGFQAIGEKEHKHIDSSKLIPIKFEVKSAPSILGFEYVRLMDENDLLNIIELFFQEYRVKYRAVKRMYETCPLSCFVYEQDRVIKGVVFGEKMSDSGVFYIHQLLIKKSEQGKHIDRVLLRYIGNNARKEGFNNIKGTARGNLLRYYRGLGAVRDRDIEAQEYLVRFQLKR